jgi:hypothetical protein
MTTSVDQQTQRRRGVGLIAHDPERAFQGYTLFTPQMRGGPPLLIDMEGNAVHEWPTPLPAGHAYLLPNGNLLVVCRAPESPARFPVWQFVRLGAVMEIDWDGNVLWEVRHPDHVLGRKKAPGLRDHPIPVVQASFAEARSIPSRI